MTKIVSVAMVLLARPQVHRGGVSVPAVSPLTILLAMAVTCAALAAVIAWRIHRADRPRGRGFTVTCGCGRPLRARVIR